MKTATQRANVEPKYEYIYANIAHLTEHLFAPSDTPLAFRYAEIKRVVAALWTTAAWTLSHGGQKSIAEQQAFYESVGTKAETWTVDGITHSGTTDECDVMEDRKITETLAKHLGDCDLIMDMGCGWGYRMVELYLYGVHTRFAGGDRSQYSREMVSRIAKLIPGISLEWFRLDFLNASFPETPIAPKKVGVYSCFAIEQVQFLGTSLFDRLLARFPDAEITGVHLEPVSFQVDPTMARERDAIKVRRYNEDLVEVISTHPQLELVHAEACLFNRYNAVPPAYVVWRKKRSV